MEADEIETNPYGEEKELALIYMTKGIEEVQDKMMASTIMQDKDKAHMILVKEELGINAEDLQCSAMEAALTSFFLFALGAIIPVIPFFFATGMKAIIISTFLSALGLFDIGASIRLFTGKSVWYSGLRQVVFRLLAAGITFGIGKLIGVAIL